MNAKNMYRIPLSISGAKEVLERYEKLTPEAEELQEQINIFYNQLPEDIKNLGYLPNMPTEEEYEELKGICELSVKVKISCNNFWKRGTIHSRRTLDDHIMKKD